MNDVGAVERAPAEACIREPEQELQRMLSNHNFRITAVSLPTLPKEIIDTILPHLAWSEIKNLRLQARRLADIGLWYFP